MPRARRKSYYESDWVPEGVYHVFTSAVTHNQLFAAPEHYRTFVETLRDRIPFFAQIFAFALITNHFHLVLRLLPEAELRAAILAKRRGARTAKEKKWVSDSGEVTYHQLIGDYWATFLALHANYVNPLLKRRGTLFNQTLRRIRVRDDLISRRLIMYVHTNEVKHKMLSRYDGSGLRTSFAYYLREGEKQWLATDVVLERFGGMREFLRKHEEYVKKYGTQISAFDEMLYFDPPDGGGEVAPYVEFLEGE